jgi:ribonuclease P protein component
MVMWLRVGEDSALRLGVVASKHVSRRAVDRARAKRLLREAYRLNRFRLCGKYDVVLVARRRILNVKLGEVVRELLDLAGKAGIMKKETD